MIPALYRRLCDQCSGDLSTEETDSCVCHFSKQPLCSPSVQKDLQEFVSFFKRIFNNSPRLLQQFWAKRLLMDESFVAVAPAGVGKTTFGIVMALFFALKGKRSYIILPTTLLVEQTVERLREFSSRAALNTAFNSTSDITVCHYPVKTKASKETFFELLTGQNFHILVTTSQFLSKNFARISSNLFNFIFVDDVDSVLKGSRNIDRILHLLGYRADSDRPLSRGLLMVSTATAGHSKRFNPLQKHLGIVVGSSRFSVRNVLDIICPGQSLDELKTLLRTMGPGGLIYTTSASEAERLLQQLQSEFNIGLVTSKTRTEYDLFIQGRRDYLIGTSSYYGSLIRGLDQPERIRYCVFWGVPLFRVDFKSIEDASDRTIRLIARLLKPDETPLLSRSSEALRNTVIELIKQGVKTPDDVVLRAHELIIPDLKTYIQGSGRTSRLYGGWLTRGASFVFEDDPDILRAFKSRAGFYDIEFTPLHEVDLQRLLKEINDSRTRMKNTPQQDPIKPTLFIVESPTKAQQIARFFGRPSIKITGHNHDGLIVYETATAGRILLITACIGHVTDLTTENHIFGVKYNGSFVPVYTTVKRCLKCNHQFTEPEEICPRCKSKEVSNSLNRLKSLRRLAYQSGLIVVGTDPDTEGEKIAWDLKNLLAGCGRIYRAEFHEITPKAINAALENLREIQEPLVKAQILRRIEDRWIGFSFSQILWKHFKDTNLSAGRAQTPVLGWIIDNADATKKKTPALYVPEYDLLLKDITDSRIQAHITIKQSYEKRLTPASPFTTHSLLNEAVTVLGYSVSETMNMAQALFDNGLITYHRTDSTRVSTSGLKIAEQFLGKDFYPRSWHSEGAHECIRPTRPIAADVLSRLIREGVIRAQGLGRPALALYDLIFRRFMASQCVPYSVRYIEYEIQTQGATFTEHRAVDASGRAYELYRWAVRIQPPLPEGPVLLQGKTLKVSETRPFTEADIVSLMKQKGIGRPSTYASILQRLFLRGYIYSKRGRLYPTPKGRAVFQFLSSRYNRFLSEERTRGLEQKMDLVEKGQLDYHQCLFELYTELKEFLQYTTHTHLP